ncbi:hypothetical protein HELRODRAFT_166571 [Helobdella robusta]|uniref:Phosphomevalonate kinase n=1 Tax=Helobdella robusta TaxID=6412 RepID=T1EY95_HELRO|nr:hypothetical protein HELRODRAFT_166571 [Helobdella robusta]ESO11565.1 hypothetical protein HELRODRAFT_166571 [Helobdella robusta]
MSTPKTIIILSGKRKSGKDFVASLLQEKLDPNRCAILRLSYPLKSQYSKDHGLDLEKLLDASDFKELYRADMIRWGEEKRNQDPMYFIRAISSEPGAEKPIWVVSDARRRSDMDCLHQLFPNIILSLRIHAEEIVRRERGWQFVHGVDDAESECGLDGYNSFDHHLENDGDVNKLNDVIDNILRSHHLLS